MIMSFNVSDKTEFAIKLTTDPETIYFNHKSIKEYNKTNNNSIAMVDTTQIEIYYLLKERDAGVAPTFSIQFERVSY